MSDREPDHPLVAVFQPVLIKDELELEARAKDFYHQIATSLLETPARETLEDVFLSWLTQRLTGKTKQEIENMLFGEVVDMRETRCGQDLIDIGRDEGRLESRISSLADILTERFGPLDAETQQRISAIQSIDEAA